MTEIQATILSQFKSLTAAEQAETLPLLRKANLKSPSVSKIVGFSVGDKIQIVSGPLTKKFEGKVLTVSKLAKSHIWCLPLEGTTAIPWPQAVDCQIAAE